jgi:hypothetical protein
MFKTDTIGVRLSSILPTVVILIVFPTIVGIYDFIIVYTEARLITDPNGVVIIQLEEPISLPLIVLVFSVYIVYGMYPFIGGNGYLEKRNSRLLVLEFELIKKLLLIGILILIGTDIIIYLVSLSIPKTIVATAFHAAVLEFGLGISIGSLLRFVSLSIKKEFRFFFVKGCCAILREEKNTLKRTEYLFLALDSYDKYLQRQLKIKIQGLGKVISNFISCNSEQRNEIIESVCKSLEGDRLQLAAYLSTLFDTSETELFVRESLVHKLRVFGAILAVAIPIIISIISSIR